MGDVLFLILRRLRAPLITLIVIYSVSIAGMVAIPGVDDQGNPWRMGFFHALYVISYTATTIGFGELPYPFTDAQRLWVIAVIYLSVIGWAYALGSVFSLSQDPEFRQAAARSLFVRRVGLLREPYCVVCGYGRSGQAIVQALDALGVRVMVVEADAQRVSSIAVQPFHRAPLVLVADARRPEVLRDAGIAKPECRAVIAVTGDDEANQSIAIGTRVLDPQTRVIARVIDPVAQSNLADFGGIEVVNPYQTFADNLEAAFSMPDVLQLEEWLTGAPGSEPAPPLRLPRGHWVLAGYGRFGRPIAEALRRTGQTAEAFDTGDLPTSDYDARVRRYESIEEGLRACGAERAVGVVAGSASDTVNLSIAVMARRCNPQVTVLMRQGRAFNAALIEAARPSLTFVQSDLMLHEVLQALTTPLLDRFISHLRLVDPQQVSRIRTRLEATVGQQVPSVWMFECDPSQAGLSGVLSNPFTPLRLDELMRDPREPGSRLRAVPLMVVKGAPVALSASPDSGPQPHAWDATSRLLRARGGFAASRPVRQAIGSDIALDAGLLLLPAEDTALGPGDRILFAGADGVEALQRRYLFDPGPIEFVRTGIDPPRGALFRWIAARRTARAAAGTGPGGA